MKNNNTNKGITLIALVITIVVMLILVAVTISMAINGGLFDYARKATGETKNAINAEQQLANVRIEIGNVWYDDIDKYIAGIPSEDQNGGTGTGNENETENDNDTVLEVPETYTKSFQAGDNITAYLVEQEEGTEEYNLLFIGTGAMWDRSLWIEELATYDSITFYYVWDYTIENVELSYGITNIPYETFYRCKSLIIITIPSSVTSIGECAFDSCYNLTTLLLPTSLTSIENWTFNSCDSLTSIIILEGVTTIGEHAFDGCDNLESVTIPSSVTSIREDAFSSCTSLTTVNYTGTAEQWSQISIGEGNDKLTSATINYV